MKSVYTQGGAYMVEMYCVKMLIISFDHVYIQAIYKVLTAETIILPNKSIRIFSKHTNGYVIQLQYTTR